MKLEHVAMYVENLEQAKAFFITYFEAVANEIYHNPNTGFSSYFLSFQDGARLELMHKPNMTKTNVCEEHFGYVHLAFCVGSKQGVDTLTKRLVEAGYELVSGPRTTGDGYYESCIKGFEGNVIEITA